MLSNRCIRGRRSKRYYKTTYGSLRTTKTTETANTKNCPKYYNDQLQATIYEPLSTTNNLQLTTAEYYYQLQQEIQSRVPTYNLQLPSIYLQLPSINN